ncbi:MAG: hypothetical protein HC795_11825, partial [Coleofasciculaceae cyanobacterium RL_1_1]|nr:hypothetical protein [Coleofasciculaceae cyanobacterium RL_1_1]
DGGRVRVYNRIYREVFNLDWAAKEQAKLRPYQEKFEAWQVVRAEVQKAVQPDTDSEVIKRGWLERRRQRRANEKQAKRLEEKLLLDKELAAAREWAQGKRLDDADYDFLTASQEARLARIQQVATRIRNVSIVGVSLAVVLAGFLGVTARRATQQAEESQQRAETALENVRIAGVRLNNERKTALNRNQYRNQQKQLLPANLWNLLIQTDDMIQDALQQNKAPESSFAKHQAAMQALRAAKMINETWVTTTGHVPTQSFYAYAADGLNTTLENVELQTLNGHSDSVNSANFSPDGKTVVSASWDNTIKLWKVESFEELLTRACQTLTPWLQNPNSDTTDADRALCNLPPRTPQTPPQKP